MTTTAYIATYRLAQHTLLWRTELEIWHGAMSAESSLARSARMLLTGGELVRTIKGLRVYLLWREQNAGNDAVSVGEWRHWQQAVTT